MMSPEAQAAVADVAGRQDQQDPVNAGAEQAGEQGNANEGEEHGRRKGGFLRKLERAESERDFWRDEALRKSESADDEPKPEAQDERPKRPRLSEYDGTKGKTLDDYENAMDDYGEKLARFVAKTEFKEKNQQSEQQRNETELAKAFEGRVKAFEKNHPDYYEVAHSPDVPATEVMLRAIAESDFGPDIAYYLGEHPEEAEAITGQSPHRQALAIGRIEARFAQAESSEGEEETVQEAPARPAKASSAPPPVQPVRRATARTDSSEPSEKDNYKDWARKREAQLRKRNGQ